MAGAGSMREIRRRIRVARNTQQITRAMQLISASKLRRAEPQMRQSGLYLRELRQVLSLVPLGNLTGGGDLLAPGRENGLPLLVLVSGDRGLCGAYNEMVTRKAMEASEGSRRFVVIGARGRDILARNGITPIEDGYYDANELSVLTVKYMAQRLVALYREDPAISAVRLVYTHYYTALNQEPVGIDILPVQVPPDGQPADIVEPLPGEILEDLLPSLVEAGLYNAVMMSVTSEHSARRNTMGSATENAQTMIDDLTRIYNRERQGAITREILDIVGGAELLGGS